MSKTEKDISDYLEAIERSGYQMESRLVSMLQESGFDVVPNVPFKDPLTGKSREIDVVFERSPFIRQPTGKTNIKSYFVVEASNNDHPFVLFTPYTMSLNSVIARYKYWISPDEETLADAGIDFDKSTQVENSDWKGVYSQYCTFQEKRSNRKELMACHSEKVYASLSKLKDYCVDSINESYSTRNRPDYWGVSFYRPILVLQNSMLIFGHDGEGNGTLCETEHAVLEFGYHSAQTALADEGPDSVFVDVITESALEPFLQTVCDEDDKLTAELFEYRNSQSA